MILGRDRSRGGVRGWTSALVVAAGIGSSLVPAPAGARQAATYQRIVDVHFRVPPGESSLLLEEGLRLEELPVLLHLARETGFAPTVVLSRRTRGNGPVSWVDVARQMDRGGSVFHVEVPPGEETSAVGRAMDLFRNTPRAAWDALLLTDAEVVALVNARVLSRSLNVRPEEALAARERTGSWAEAASRLLGSARSPQGRS